MKKKKKKVQVVTGQNKIIFFLALTNSAHLSIDVHCSNGIKKNKGGSASKCETLAHVSQNKGGMIRTGQTVLA